MYWFSYPIGFMLNTLWMPNVGRFKVNIDVVLLPLATSFRLKTLTCLYQKCYQDQCKFTLLFTIVLVLTLPMWFHGILFKFIPITQRTVLGNSVVPTWFCFPNLLPLIVSYSVLKPLISFESAQLFSSTCASRNILMVIARIEKIQHPATKF